MNIFYTANCALVSALTSPSTPNSVVEFLRTEIKIKTYLKGEYIFISDQEVPYIIGINSGLAKMYYMDHFGNEFILKLLVPGDISGHRQIVENEKFFGYIQVLEEAEVCQLSRETYLRLLEQDISMNKRLIEHLTSEVRAAKEIISNLSLKDVKQRICSVLIFLHNKFSFPGIDEINSELSREDLAKLVGVARESLSRSLGELVSEKVIEIDKRRIRVLDWKQLNKLAKL